MTGAATTVAEAVRTAYEGRRLLSLSGATGDWFLTDDTAIRLPEYMAQLAAELNLGMILYRRSQAPEELVPPGRSAIPGLRLPRETDPRHVVPDLLRLAANPNQRVLVLFEGVENLLPDAESPVSNPDDLDLLDQLQRLPVTTDYSFGSSLVVLAERAAPVHHRLRQSPGVYAVAVPLPSLEERAAFLQLPEHVPGHQIADIAERTAGLSLDETNFLSSTARRTDSGIETSGILARKADMLRTFCPNLELIETAGDLDGLAGMEQFKQWIQDAMARGRLPSMIVLVGPPGTGKTHGARSLAGTLGLTMLKLHIMNSPYIGENERLLLEAQRRIASMGSLIVWIDELDQQLMSRRAGATGDSGTTNRLMASILEWTGDPANRSVTLVGATNRPDRLDNAMNDRAQLVVPFLHATPHQLEGLIPQIASQSGLELDTRLDVREFARDDALRAVSGRDLHQILERAHQYAFRAGKDVVTADSLRQAILAVPPQQRDEDRYWTLLALAYATDTQLFPWAGNGRVTDEMVPFYARGFVDEAGAIDQAQLGTELAAYARRFA